MYWVSVFFDISFSERFENWQNASCQDEMQDEFEILYKKIGKKTISKIEIENEKVLKAGEPKLWMGMWKCILHLACCPDDDGIGK